MREEEGGDEKKRRRFSPKGRRNDRLHEGINFRLVMQVMISLIGYVIHQFWSPSSRSPAAAQAALQGTTPPHARRPASYALLRRRATSRSSAYQHATPRRRNSRRGCRSVSFPPFSPRALRGPARGPAHLHAAHGARPTKSLYK